MPESEPNPSQPPKDTPGDAVDENEISRVLDEAGDLSRSLGNEVGEPEIVPGSLADLETLSETSDTPKLDDELDRVESLLRDASDGEAPPPESAAEQVNITPRNEAGELVAAQVPLADAGDEAALPHAPDGPVEEAVATVEEAGKGNEAEAEPSGEGEEETAAESSEGGDQAVEGVETPEPSESSEPPATEELIETNAPAVSVSRGARVKMHLRPIAEAVVHGGLRALDLIDQVFAFVNYGTRAMLGWVALVIVVAAGAIFAFSASPWSP